MPKLEEKTVLSYALSAIESCVVLICIYNSMSLILIAQANISIFPVRNKRKG